MIFTQVSIVKESGRIVPLSLKVESRVESLGYLVLFCFLKNRPFLRLNEKELDSSVSEAFKPEGTEFG